MTTDRHILINRDYALFMGGSFVSALGSWFQGVALGWLVLELSDSPFALGVVNFALMAPLFFLGIAGGVLADSISRRTLLLGGMSVSAIALAVLAVLALTGLATVPTIVAVTLVIGLTQAVVWPAWQPFIKDLVPVDRLREAIAFNSARFNLSRVLGPALAGLTIAQFGAGVCLAIAALGSAAVIVATWLIRPPPARQSRAGPWREALDEGIRYVRHDSITLRLMLVSGAFGLLVLPYQAFLPAFARDILNIGPEGLGALLTVIGGGAVVGALLSGSGPVAQRPGPAMAAFAALAGAGLAGFAAASPVEWLPPWVAMALLAVAGFGSIGYLTAANSTLQLRVPDALVGRVMGLWVVMNAGTTPLGSLAVGALAERIGLPLVVFATGIVGLALAAFLLRAVPRSLPEEARPVPTDKKEPVRAA
ncbi:MAG: MFS transporter [Chloroflexi bacterium]|nr:MFS transporter [Chloroflexota bacterium]